MTGHDEPAPACWKEKPSRYPRCTRFALSSTG
jgi:hypothetical protein